MILNYDDNDIILSVFYLCGNGIYINKISEPRYEITMKCFF